MKLRVGFIGNSDIAQQLSSCHEIEVVFDASDGISGLRYQQSHNADVVVTEIVLSGLDGYKVCESLVQSQNCPRLVILTELKGDVFISKAMELGVSDFINKPCTPQRFLDVLNSVSTSKAYLPQVERPKALNRTLDEKLSTIFISVGIPAHIKGYQFLREGIKLAVNNPPIINSITKSLYPSIAAKYETTPSKVERAIRHAIEVAWNRGKIENINSLFGVKVYNSNEKPTNGEFIALLADKMLLECVY